jgi:soluble lytic murein transglycosylase-like protein
MIEQSLMVLTALLLGTTPPQIGRPELSMPKPSAQGKKIVEMRNRELGRIELAKLKLMIKSLGGDPEFAAMLQRAGREFQIDPVFLTAVTFVESGFRPRAASSKGARGMMQLRPVVLDVLGVTDPWDPAENVMAGAAYLNYCFERYRQNSDSTYLVLAAYNIGPGSVGKLTRSEPASRFVKKVLSVYNKFTDKPIQVRTFNEQPKTASPKLHAEDTRPR